MKKRQITVACVLLFALLVIGLAACGDKNSDENDFVEAMIMPDMAQIEVNGTFTFTLTEGQAAVWDVGDRGTADIMEFTPNTCTVVGISDGETWLSVENENGESFANPAHIIVISSKSPEGEGGGPEGENPPTTSGHVLTLVPAKTQTCIEDGHNQYYTCSHCDKWFNDPDGLHEIEDKDQVIWEGDASHHNWDGDVCTICGADKIPDKMDIIGAPYSTECTIHSYNGSATELTLPTKFYYEKKVYPITSIDYSAFKNCDSLQSVVVPEGIKRFGWQVFAGCINLTNVQLPESLVDMGTETFEACTSLESIYIPSKIHSLDGANFAGCTSLTEVTGGDGLWTISKDAFDELENYSGEPYEATPILKNFLDSSDDDMLYIAKCLYRVKPGIKHFLVKDGTIGVSDDIFPDGSYYDGNSFISNVVQVSLPDSLEYFMCGYLNMNSSYKRMVNLAKTSGVGYEHNGVYYLGNSDNHYVAAVCLTQKGYSMRGEIELHPDTRIICSNCFGNEGTSRCTLKEFPDGLKAIGEYAFRWATLTKIVLPDGLAYLGDNAFNDLSNDDTDNNEPIDIEIFDTGDGIESLPANLLGSNYEIRIERVRIGAKVRYIDDSAFEIESIGTLAYAGGLNQLFEMNYRNAWGNPGYYADTIEGIGTTLVIPEDRSSINDYAFAGMKIETIVLASWMTARPEGLDLLNYLKNVRVAQGNTKLTSLDGVLYSADKTTLEFIPPKWEGDLVIPKETAWMHVNGSSNGINSITVEPGNEYFYSENDTVFTNYGEGKAIGLGSKNSVITNDVVLIDSYAFANVVFDSLTLDGSQYTLSDHAFENCTFNTLELIGATEETDPRYYFGWRAFVGATVGTLKAPLHFFYEFSTNESELTVTNIEINGPIVNNGVIGANYYMPHSTVTAKICEGYTAISAQGAFGPLSELTEITLPSTMTQIRYNAFEFCENLATVNGGENLEFVSNLSSSNTNPFLFDGTKVFSDIGENEVRYIGKILFAIGKNVTELEIREGTTMGHIQFQLDGYNTYVYQLRKLIIPTSLDHSNDAEWNEKYHPDNGYKYFYGLSRVNCKYLEEVAAPASMFTSGYDSFELNTTDDVPQLTKLKLFGGNLSAKNNLASIGKNLTELDLSDMTELPNGMLKGLGKLKKLVLPFLADTLANSTLYKPMHLGRLFGSESFEGASSVHQTIAGVSQGANFYIPDTLTSVTVNAGDIGTGAFENCANLTEFVYGGSELTTIRDAAFKGCKGITSFEFVNSIKSIGIEAFAESGLTEVDLMTEVDSNSGTIGQGAFRGCVDLTRVSFGQINQIAPQMFMGCTSLTTVNIPYTMSTIGAEAFKDSGVTTVYFETAPAALPDAYKSVWAVANTDTPQGTSDFTSVDSYIYNSAEENATRLKSGEWSTKQLAHFPKMLMG